MTIGHSLGTIAVQAGVGRQLMEPNPRERRRTGQHRSDQPGLGRRRMLAGGARLRAGLRSAFPLTGVGLNARFLIRTGEVRVITASFDAASAGAPTTWYQDRIPRLPISSSVIIFAAPAVIIASKGQLGRRAGAASGQQDGDTAGEHIPDPPASRKDPPRSDPPDV
jgi:hypothetical protein